MATGDKGWYLGLLEWRAKFSIRFLLDSVNPMCPQRSPRPSRRNIPTDAKHYSRHRTLIRRLRYK
jgi:hypothetical protein